MWSRLFFRKMGRKNAQMTSEQKNRKRARYKFNKRAEAAARQERETALAEERREAARLEEAAAAEEARREETRKKKEGKRLEYDNGGKKKVLIVCKDCKTTFSVEAWKEHGLKSDNCATRHARAKRAAEEKDGEPAPAEDPAVVRKRTRPQKL